MHSSPVRLLLSFHRDEERARPRFYRYSMLFGGGASHVFKVHLGAFEGTTELSGCWQAKPARDSLVTPFLEQYNQAGVGPAVGIEDVVGLSIEGCASPSGADALHAAPRDFVFKAASRRGVTHVTICVRGEPPPACLARWAAAARVSRSASSAPSPGSSTASSAMRGVLK